MHQHAQIRFRLAARSTVIHPGSENVASSLKPLVTAVRVLVFSFRHNVRHVLPPFI